MAALMRWRPTWRVLAGAAAAVTVIVSTLAYVSMRDPLPTRNAPVEKLSIAFPVVPHLALVHVAVAKGFFAEEGLDASILPTIHGKAAVGLVVQGNADLAVAADVPFVIAIMKGNALGMVGSVSSVSRDNAIIARRDHAIASSRDLEGKKVGVTFGTGASYYLWAFLIRHKLPADSITLVDLPPDRIVGALASGSVDAVAVWQPLTSDAQAALGSNALPFTETAMHRSTFAVIGRSEYLRGHGDRIERLVRALLKAEQFMRSHPEETLTLVAAWLKTDVETIRPTWNQFDFSVNLPQSLLINLEDEARWAMKREYVAQGPIPNFLPNLYLDALLAVKPERVSVIR